MLALYKYSDEAYASKLVDLPVPEIDHINNVLVRVDAVTCCGMDNHIYQGKFDCSPPFVMGHEFVGKVQEIMPNSQGKIRVGQRVVCEPHLYSCGTCVACISGAPQNCLKRKSLGIHRDGAMAEFVKVPEKNLHPIPDSISNDIACLIEPMTILYTDIIAKAGLSEGETVAIWGAGPVGIFAGITAKYAGAGKIILIGSNSDKEYRFPVAKKMGVDFIVNYEKENPIENIDEITEGKGVDLAVECSGSVKAIQEAIISCKVNKRVTNLGLTRGKTVGLDWDSVLKKMLTLHFNMMADYKFMEETINMVNSYPLPLLPLITRRGSLNDYKELFSDLAKGTMVKLLFNISS